MQIKLLPFWISVNIIPERGKPHLPKFKSKFFKFIVESTDSESIFINTKYPCISTIFKTFKKSYLEKIRGAIVKNGYSLGLIRL